MRYLFVTYCFGGAEGQTLIGVYKRGLRIALELSDRGHEIFFFCTGRDGYHDELTRTAQVRLQFIDLPSGVVAFEKAERYRYIYLQALEQIAPDIVVIGEAPLAGAMLETTLCAVERDVPVVLLDNAYSPSLVELFCQVLGPMVDGLILTGPTAHHTQTPPPYLYQVPPFIQSSPQAARALLADELGLQAKKLITVLAYDAKVERFATSLLQALDHSDLDVLFLTRDPEKCQAQLDAALGNTKANVRAIFQPSDPVFFGILEQSQLAVVKYGFMQVTECMALHTPVIVVYHEGPTWLDVLPDVCRQFAWVTHDTEANAETLAAAQRLLDLDPAAMQQVHDGTSGAAQKAAEVLETIPTTPRQGTDVESAALDFTEERLLAALSTFEPTPPLLIHTVRAMRLRASPRYQLFSIVCSFSANSQPHCTRFWGRVYTSEDAARDDYQAAHTPESKRSVRYFSETDRILIEDDLGQAELPPLNP